MKRTLLILAVVFTTSVFAQTQNEVVNQNLSMLKKYAENDTLKIAIDDIAFVAQNCQYKAVRNATVVEKDFWSEAYSITCNEFINEALYKYYNGDAAFLTRTNILEYLTKEIDRHLNSATGVATFADLRFIDFKGSAIRFLIDDVEYIIEPSDSVIYMYDVENEDRGCAYTHNVCEVDMGDLLVYDIGNGGRAYAFCISEFKAIFYQNGKTMVDVIHTWDKEKIINCYELSSPNIKVRYTLNSPVDDVVDKSAYVSTEKSIIIKYLLKVLMQKKEEE